MIDKDLADRVFGVFESWSYNGFIEDEELDYLYELMHEDLTDEVLNVLDALAFQGAIPEAEVQEVSEMLSYVG